jgi:aminoglycoside phosphotransferase (APT) family kinase protein
VPVKKPDITPELVSRLVAAQFPQWAELPIRPVDVDGWDNATFRLGESMSVRLPSSQAYAEQVEKEHRWLPILALAVTAAANSRWERAIRGSSSK